ncbi:MAG: hypothetical protein A3C93_05005 [Candidatus Lloydbacteria bacterium RIFCSPHIGHO2_02_FULL_54_17]|uniref:Peptidoglycan binding-like domain-containing protein n=1 Tax=Candidatus Lloydbacteria bacterium RIFCSPHIGHO2_02_FULL_54_17 TaxID=1798664 RepID=A0A1G2DEC5_9BACT|nr:MAG: hypothetical protein A2762_02890 [Candidatus Lloydbacteria bacterium RIFCSPHIGHO2_01_FULL_54_11]OGZ11128.1 MAG: hypothetical protein A3C93_05005 [Candidatus Lloydbacteria bacterium RIFCSPHIGHO2_02_FULL_54_17]OGZ14519.1 MAG: hypothetical protein A2948_05200 [Candidatus Lloydbacteria bacterium RIFCSPLOWO2_01_FULL_54_18]OGZ16951.1 MAG: hypothetical protein A3H76_03425 [Candidatus Lloydbacteria bacterium RIFCSPLOWO2_02_FULL_54_12]
MKNPIFLRKGLFTATLVPLLVFPLVSFAAISYTRSPEGASVTSPVTVTLSAGSFADFGLSTNVDRFYITLDDDFNPRTECYPVSQFPVTATFHLPPGDVVKGVMIVGFTNFCESGDEPYYLEGDGTGAIFTVSGAGSVASPSGASVTATKALPIPPKTQSTVTSNTVTVPVVGGAVPASGSVSVPLPISANTATQSGFTRDLTLGSTGVDVRALQVWLNTHGHIVAGSGAGSLGNESNYFGKLTQAAVAKFQTARGITPVAGYFGPKTRAAIQTQ